jgi:hypothetical protein
LTQADIVCRFAQPCECRAAFLRSLVLTAKFSQWPDREEIEWLGSGVEQGLPNHLHFRQLDLGQCVVAQLGRNVRQSNCVLANWIAGHKAERRPRAGEEGLAATQHDRAEVEAILINKTKVGQASR